MLYSSGLLKIVFMNRNEIINKIKQGDSLKIKLAVSDIDGVLRGKVIHKEKFLEIVEKTIGICNVIFGWDSNDTCYDNVSYTGWHTGYPDADARIDLETMRYIPWDNNIPFFLADFSALASADLAVCPRSLLKRISKQCEDMGYTPLFSQEFEWYNFENNPNELAASNYNKLKPISPGMFGYSILRPSLKNEYFNALFDFLAKFDIPLEGLHTETGPGVYEAAIRYDQIVKAADKAILFKTAVKEIATRFGIIASFMSKWNKDLPGCSGHIHQSLWNNEKKVNLFFDPNDQNNMSDLMKSYIAGQLKCLPFIVPMYAPTINSYKRLNCGSWAPGTISWGIDNRTSAVRVLNKDMYSTRSEMRVAGSDTNPYLAMAASLASGIYGIQNNLKLDIPASKANAYNDTKNGLLPSNLYEATVQMKQSEIARELFGADFVKHYTDTREWEWRQYSKQVTDWEIKRYFEII
jgi:glutamine synthetase